jgi:integrase/recombinase XerD
MDAPTRNGVISGMDAPTFDGIDMPKWKRYFNHLNREGRPSHCLPLNATISGLKFFFDVTLSRGELMAKMQPVSVPRTLPVVLSREDVSRLIAAA